MSQSNTAIVVPTCREFTLPSQDRDVDWIIVHDQKERRIAGYHAPDAINLIAPDPEMYGEKTSAIRQAGLDYAYDAGYDFVLTADDDCELPRDWATKHVAALSSEVSICNNTCPPHVIRGLPKGGEGTMLPVGISHGLWSGVLDYPAEYQLKYNPGLVEIEDKGWEKISFPFPMCGMNVGFRREVLPCVYFQHQFLRHDDIFAGWIAQKILSDLGYGFVNGGAVVQHNRASDPVANMAKEAPGDWVNAALLNTLINLRPGSRHLTIGTLQVRMWMYTYTPGEYFAGVIDVLAHQTSYLNTDINNQFQRMVADMKRWSNRKESK